MQIKDGFVKKEICMLGFIIMMILLFLVTCISFVNRIDELENVIEELNDRLAYVEEVLEHSTKYRADAIDTNEYSGPLEIQWGM